MVGRPLTSADIGSNATLSLTLPATSTAALADVDGGLTTVASGATLLPVAHQRGSTQKHGCSRAPKREGSAYSR